MIRKRGYNPKRFHPPAPDEPMWDRDPIWLDSAHLAYCASGDVATKPYPYTVSPLSPTPRGQAVFPTVKPRGPSGKKPKPGQDGRY